VFVCKYTHLCVLGAEGNAPLGHTLTDSSTTALILIITGREGTLRNLIYTHTRARVMTQVSLETPHDFGHELLHNFNHKNT